jgi:hypothetical protein
MNKDTKESVKIVDQQKEQFLKFYTELWPDISHKEMTWQMTMKISQ